MKFRFLLLLCALALPTRAAQLVAASRAGNVAVLGDGYWEESGTPPQIWSLAPLKQCLILRADGRKLTSVLALSRDGRFVAFGCKDGTMRVFNTRSGSLLARLGRAENVWYKRNKITALAFSPDGRTLASGNVKGVFLWNWKTQTLRYSRQLRFVPRNDPGKPLRVGADLLRFSSNGRTLAIGGGNASQDDEHGNDWGSERFPVFLMNVAKRQPRFLSDVDAGDGGPQEFAFSAGANRLLVVSSWAVSLSNCNYFRLFDARTGRLLWTRDNAKDEGGYMGETGYDINSATFSRDERRVLWSGSDSCEERRARDGFLLRRIEKTDLPPLKIQKQLFAELGVR